MINPDGVSKRIYSRVRRALTRLVVPIAPSDRPRVELALDGANDAFHAGFAAARARAADDVPVFVLHRATEHAPSAARHPGRRSHERAAPPHARAAKGLPGGGDRRPSSEGTEPGDAVLHRLLGESAERDHRLVYAEGITDENAAIALLGTQRLDRTIAKAFFDDQKRLQRDVLGDAVEAQLQAFAMPVIEV